MKYLKRLITCCLVFISAISHWQIRVGTTFSINPALAAYVSSYQYASGLSLSVVDNLNVRLSAALLPQYLSFCFLCLSTLIVEYSDDLYPIINGREMESAGRQVGRKHCLYSSRANVCMSPGAPDSSLCPLRRIAPISQWSSTQVA